jgi:hypothetical protein
LVWSDIEDGLIGINMLATAPKLTKRMKTTIYLYAAVWCE